MVSQTLGVGVRAEELREFPSPVVEVEAECSGLRWEPLEFALKLLFVRSFHGPTPSLQPVVVLADVWRWWIFVLPVFFAVQRLGVKGARQTF